MRYFNGLAICAGIEGIGLGLARAIPGYRTVCVVEREAYCAAVLVSRQKDGSLPPFPIWDDVTTFDGRRWRGVVDIIHAGVPCQPWSCAGKQLGTADERWIWSDIYRVIREVEPPFVFLEEVPGFVRGGGLGYVLSDLAKAGFDAEWCCVTASEIGAPHRRERLFILGHLEHSRSPRAHILTKDFDQQGALSVGESGGQLADSPGEQDHQEQRRPEADEGERSPDCACGCGASLADAASPRREGAGQYGSGPSPQEGCGALGNAECTERRPHLQHDELPGGRQQAADRPECTDSTLGNARQQGRGQMAQPWTGERSSAESEWSGLPPFPPGPSDRQAWSAILERWPHLAPALADSRSDRRESERNDGGDGREGQSVSGNGVRQEASQPDVCGVAHGLSSRVDRLSALGNAVVPAQAEYALRTLWKRILTQSREFGKMITPDQTPVSTIITPRTGKFLPPGRGVHMRSDIKRRKGQVGIYLSKMGQDLMCNAAISLGMTYSQLVEQAIREYCFNHQDQINFAKEYKQANGNNFR